MAIELVNSLVGIGGGRGWILGRSGLRVVRWNLDGIQHQQHDAYFAKAQQSARVLG